MATPDTTANVTEEPYVELAPEPGDQYFEMEDPDGEWISYENPRDEYRSPYLGDGSGKVCVTLRNEAGEPIVGDTLENTTITIPTGESLDWHSDAGPMEVHLPLTEHYTRPLDADQFGTSPDIPQGDGYMDSHCIEFHGMPLNSTISYGEATVTGEYADWLDVAGYIQQAHHAWDTDVDPMADAQSYEAAGGGWHNSENGSHGQVIVVLTLDPPEYATHGETVSSSNETSADGTNQEDGGDSNDSDEHSNLAGSPGTQDTESGQADESEADDRSEDVATGGDSDNSTWDTVFFVGIGSLLVLSLAGIVDVYRKR